MMKIVAAAVVGLALLVGTAQVPGAGYDAELAKKLGADDYGMRMYALVMLRTGPKTDLPKEENEQLFRGHMANMSRLATEGALAFAGPLEKNDDYRGLFIFNVKTKAEAEALLATDPAVKGGALAADIYMLYGSAALQEVAALHDRISKKKP